MTLDEYKERMARGEWVETLSQSIDVEIRYRQLLGGGSETISVQFPAMHVVKTACDRNGRLLGTSTLPLTWEHYRDARDKLKRVVEGVNMDWIEDDF